MIIPNLPSLYVNHSEAKPAFNTKLWIWKKFSRILITLSIFYFRAWFLAHIVEDSVKGGFCFGVVDVLCVPGGVPEGIHNHTELGFYKNLQGSPPSFSLGQNTTPPQHPCRVLYCIVGISWLWLMAHTGCRGTSPPWSTASPWWLVRSS